MGSKSRSGGGGGGGQQAAPTYSYGGNSGMTQAQAQQKYQTDLANWRAPTAVGTGAATGVPVGPANPGYDGGPALPGVGVPLTAPTMDPMKQRNILASLLRPYQPQGGGGGRGAGNGYGGSWSGGRQGSGGYSTGSATGGFGRGSSASMGGKSSGGLY